MNGAKESAAGSTISSSVPASGPASVPAPPMITIASSSTDWSSVKLSTLTNSI